MTPTAPACAVAVIRWGPNVVQHQTPASRRQQWVINGAMQAVHVSSTEVMCDFVASVRAPHHRDDDGVRCS